MDHTIIRHVKKAYNLLIGERSAEEIKINIATVFPGAKNEEMDIKGRDMISGLPKTINIKSDEIRIVLEESALAIVQAVKSVLERTPPELSADIIEKGIYLTGGGALLHGLDRLLAEHLLVPVFIADEPLTCVARGTGIMLHHLDKAPKQRI